jgi:hypothetical protein
VTQERGEHWQLTLDVLACAIPSQKRLRCKAVPEVMQRGFITIFGRMQSDSTAKKAKCLHNGTD